MTPEGRIKAKVNRLLQTYGVYSFMPVPGGFGQSGLDYHCCHHGYALFIETKAPGRKLTARQQYTADMMRAAEATVMVIDGDISFSMLQQWLHGICLIHGCKDHPLGDRSSDQDVVEFSE